ncbi:hypothetical protein [Cribrihabitans pelagius]|uniref:hypothetical protein n=1 Tax=Cribrihabitans pelagius TaxID=1765746 RepID=UPI003B5B7D42
MHLARVISAAALALLGLAACGPLPVYYRQGAEVSRLQADELACEAEALQQAPVASQIRQRPPIYRPGGRFCHHGDCRYHSSIWVEGSYYTVDVNRPLRLRLERACMAGKGYQQLSLKRCPQGQARAAGPALPPLGPGNCALRTRGGTTLVGTSSGG